MINQPPTIGQKLRLSKRKVVTIAAGVMCPDGIVLAADSQETVGESLKVYKPKLVELPLLSPDLKAVVVASGTGPFIDMLVERISEELDLVNPFIASARQAIQKAVSQICDDIWPHYTTQNDKPNARLLIGLRASDGLTMFDAYVPMVKVADRYAFIGWGGDLATYKAKQLLLAGLPAEIATNLVVHILDVVKDNVEFCGGPTQVAVIKADGAVEHKDAAYLARVSQGYKNAALAFDCLSALLPVLVAPDGRSLVTLAAEAAVENSDLSGGVNEAISLIMAHRANLLANPSEETRDVAQASLAFAASLQSLQVALVKFRDTRIISVETYERIDQAWRDAAKNGIEADRSLKAGDLSAGRKYLLAAFCQTIIPITSLQLAAQTLEGQ